MDKKTIVLGVIGSDCHAVGNTILDYTLNQAGFDVENIGVLSPQEDFINAAVETSADAILVSSLYGHGEIDARGMREAAEEAGIGDILLYIGGNIVVGKQEWEEVHQTFKDMGFDKVYAPGTSVEQTIEDLEKDLNA